jgi:Ca2+-transporting ATPase
VFTTDSFDSTQMNWAPFSQFVLAVLTTQMDAFRRLLDTTELHRKQFRRALIPPIALLFPWELGKLIARHQARLPASP